MLYFERYILSLAIWTVNVALTNSSLPVNEQFSLPTKRHLPSSNWLLSPSFSWWKHSSLSTHETDYVAFQADQMLFQRSCLICPQIACSWKVPRTHLRSITAVSFSTPDMFTQMFVADVSDIPTHTNTQSKLPCIKSHCKRNIHFMSTCCVWKLWVMMLLTLNPYGKKLL